MSRDDLEYYEHLLCVARAKKLLPLKVPINHSVEPCGDYVNAYLYGDNLLKFVYIKNRGKVKKGKNPISTNDDESRRADSIARAKKTVNELALCNNFEFFCTFTQNSALRDRFDLTEFRKDLSRFIRNENRGREKKIKYVLIPEQHQDGAYHMHGLLMGLEVGKDLVINENGYLDWKRYRTRFGFFSCSKIKDKKRCANYVTKYITKGVGELQNEKKQHLFFASQGLKRRETIVYQGSPLDFGGEWDYENDYCKIAFIDLS